MSSLKDEFLNMKRTSTLYNNNDKYAVEDTFVVENCIRLVINTLPKYIWSAAVT